MSCSKCNNKSKYKQHLRTDAHKLKKHCNFLWVDLNKLDDLNFSKEEKNKILYILNKIKYVENDYYLHKIDSKCHIQQLRTSQTTTKYTKNNIDNNKPQDKHENKSIFRKTKQQSHTKTIKIIERVSIREKAKQNLQSKVGFSEGNSKHNFGLRNTNRCTECEKECMRKKVITTENTTSNIQPKKEKHKKEKLSKKSSLYNEKHQHNKPCGVTVTDLTAKGKYTPGSFYNPLNEKRKVTMNVKYDKPKNTISSKRDKENTSDNEPPEPEKLSCSGTDSHLLEMPYLKVRKLNPKSDNEDNNSQMTLVGTNKNEVLVVSQVLKYKFSNSTASTQVQYSIQPEKKITQPLALTMGDMYNKRNEQSCNSIATKVSQETKTDNTKSKVQNVQSLEENEIAQVGQENQELPQDEHVKLLPERKPSEKATPMKPYPPQLEPRPCFRRPSNKMHPIEDIHTLNVDNKTKDNVKITSNSTNNTLKALKRSIIRCLGFDTNVINTEETVNNSCSKIGKSKNQPSTENSKSNKIVFSRAEHFISMENEIRRKKGFPLRKLIYSG